MSWDFPGSPVVKTSPSDAVPRGGARIPQASRLKRKNKHKQQKQCCKKFNKDLKRMKEKKSKMI